MGRLFPAVIAFGYHSVLNPTSLLLRLGFTAWIIACSNTRASCWVNVLKISLTTASRLNSGYLEENNEA